MNIAQSFEKLRYGLYLEPLGSLFERKTYYRTDKIWMELEQCNLCNSSIATFSDATRFDFL